MRNYLWLAVLLLVATTCSDAKPVVSFGLGYQQPFVGPQPGAYYYGGPYQPGSYYHNYHSSPGPYGYPYPYANRYGALDVGLGALSLSAFLL
ncbi:uncharacterized protein LOC108089373 [Drosophila ficusphila]|uniref:uncharacterized protein LOC108089373 n=1 Tax=Drosophila ficusphila TaxID=30025 RepID=UPI0007E702A6|nr:uncharacterized protein LOC108089373 [Drosophila ficusphila]